jgi:predicted kinase
MKRLIIMQGCSGSGKSFVANMIKGYWDSLYFEGFEEADDTTLTVCSTDDFFMVDGKYKFDQSKLHANHQKCQAKAENAMILGHEVVIVDNTNCKQWEADPYILMGKKHGYDTQVISVSASRELIDKQNESRSDDRAIPSDVIDRQISKMERIKL